MISNRKRRRQSSPSSCRRQGTRLSKRRMSTTRRTSSSSSIRTTSSSSISSSTNSSSISSTSSSSSSRHSTTATTPVTRTTPPAPTAPPLRFPSCSLRLSLHPLPSLRLPPAHSYQPSPPPAYPPAQDSAFSAPSPLAAFFDPREPPPAAVAPPAREEVRGRVEKAAEYAAKNGPQFEALMRDKQRGHPTYGFLEPGGEGADYYRFRLWRSRALRLLRPPIPPPIPPLPFPRSPQLLPKRRRRTWRCGRRWRRRGCRWTWGRGGGDAGGAERHQGRHQERQGVGGVARRHGVGAAHRVGAEGAHGGAERAARAAAARHLPRQRRALPQQRPQPSAVDAVAGALQPCLGFMLAALFHGGGQQQSSNQERLGKILAFWATKE
ncbi:hypothetical protein CLOP_g24462, partial [Closterium sp. NIES-67]